MPLRLGAAYAQSRSGRFSLYRVSKMAKMQLVAGGLAKTKKAPNAGALEISLSHWK